MLGQQLPKVHAVRCGDWLAQPLSAEQVEYAALDAAVGQRVLAALHSRWGDRGGVREWCGEYVTENN